MPAKEFGPSRRQVDGRYLAGSSIAKNSLVWGEPVDRTCRCLLIDVVLTRPGPIKKAKAEQIAMTAFSASRLRSCERLPVLSALPRSKMKSTKSSIQTGFTA